MNSWRKHLALGLFLEFIFVSLMYFKFNWFRLSDILYIVMVCLLSPLIMDIDHNKSRLGKESNKLGLIVIGVGLILYYFTEVWYLIIIGLIVSYLASFTPSFIKHRGIIHSIFFCIMYGGIIYLLSGMELAMLGIFGCYTHLLGDKLFFKLF